MSTVTAAQLVPQNVEKLPLFHWRPGTRVLMVGSRDGADFAGDSQRDATSFKRTLTADLLITAQRQAGTDGVCAAWNSSLHEPAGVDLLAEHRQGALVVAASGHGDPALLDRLLPVVDAWVLLLDHAVAPLSQRILLEGRHVEVLWGVEDAPVQYDLPWYAADAVHLTPRHHRHLPEPGWHDAVRQWLPAHVPLYDSEHLHTRCACGATLVWRSGGRSRVDSLDLAIGTCTACGREHSIIG